MGSRAEAGARLRRAAAQRRARSIGTKFLALEHSFHGRTLGSVSPRTKQSTASPSRPSCRASSSFDSTTSQILRAKFSNDVCAICLESIQGEGGIRPVSPGVAETARELAEATGALLIADEIQSRPGTHRQVVCLSALRHPAGHRHGGQADRRRASARRHAVHGRGLARHSSRHARHNIRRRPAGLRRGDRSHRRP